MKFATTCALLAALSEPAYATGMFIGTRGPTQVQFDQRASYSSNGSFALSAVPKYWNGKECGIWAGAVIPYKHSSSGQTGLGDVNVFGGPRFTLPGGVHFLPYAGATLPTAQDGLGNGRTDVKAGVHGTYLREKSEVSFSAEYNATGNGKPDELWGGVLTGRQLGKQRAAACIMALKRNADYSVNARAIFRQPITKRLHVEGIVDRGIKGRQKPTTATLIVRYNAGPR